MAMLNDVMSQLAAGNVFSPLGNNLSAFAGPRPRADIPALAANPAPAGPMPMPASFAADANAPIGIQTLGAPTPAPGMVGITNAQYGRPEQAPRPQFGSYIPQGLVNMLMRLQQNNPDRFAGMFDRGFAQRFGLTPETDLANLYTRNMARQDWRGGTDPLAAGTVLTPEQRTAYPAMKQWPQYAGGGMGNQAPAQPGAQGQGFAPDLNRPVGMAAERKAPGSGGY